MPSHTPKSFPRSLALASLLQTAAALLALGSAHAQVTSPFERTLNGTAGTWQFFPIEIPAGTTKLNVVISGGTGDADLYVRPLEQPNDRDFSCRPWLDGSDETCTTDNPQAATWYIALNAWTDFTDVKLTATWDAPAPRVPPVTDPTTAGLTDWQKEMLDQHNLLRAKHCSPTMTWDAELAKAAQEWANRCQWEHAKNTGEGENLAAAASGHPRKLQTSGTSRSSSTTSTRRAASMRQVTSHNSCGRARPSSAARKRPTAPRPTSQPTGPRSARRSS